ncbi:MAG: MBL fold metallo-hydrolase [Candidatus Nanopelagicales bacterium]|nr:MBL fold metallo-hydrolase [Candidatus Nanopelagicales bacterium]
MTITDRPHITVTGHLQKEAWRVRELPPVELVRPGLWSIPVIFPNNPLRYVNVYVIEVPNGIVLVDAGWPVDEAWENLNDGIQSIGYSITDVEGVLVTHNHADHLGLAGRIRDASGAWIAMHELDQIEVDFDVDPEVFKRAGETWLIKAGVEESDMPDLIIDAGQFVEFAKIPKADRLIVDGERPLPGAQHIRTLWTPGHSPGHVCFIDEKHDLLISGDHVLPRISPHISVHPREHGDPLGLYIDSLNAMRGMNPEEILPAHEYRFSGLDARIEQMNVHHEERLTEVLNAISEHPGAGTYEISSKLSWSHGWDNTHGMLRRAAMGETLAHIVHLERRGLINNIPRDGRMYEGDLITTDAWFPAALG